MVVNVFFQTCPLKPKIGTVVRDQYRSNIFQYELLTPSGLRDRSIWNFGVSSGFFSSIENGWDGIPTILQGDFWLIVFNPAVLRAQKCFSLHFFCKSKLFPRNFSFSEFWNLVVSNFWAKIPLKSGFDQWFWLAWVPPSAGERVGNVFFGCFIVK